MKITQAVIWSLTTLNLIFLYLSIFCKFDKRLIVIGIKNITNGKIRKFFCCHLSGLVTPKVLNERKNGHIYFIKVYTAIRFKNFLEHSVISFISWWFSMCDLLHLSHFLVKAVMANGFINQEILVLGPNNHLYFFWLYF